MAADLTKLVKLKDPRASEPSFGPETDGVTSESGIADAHGAWWTVCTASAHVVAIWGWSGD